MIIKSTEGVLINMTFPNKEPVVTLDLTAGADTRSVSSYITEEATHTRAGRNTGYS